ncbi:MAG TPA: hypothetical protein VD907_01650 [Verrucomicrobiae bacterium]|nr:hypothetical protein [Verrucomicrobiae bacterium]
MLVHFIATRSNLEDDLKYFSRINRIVCDLGHTYTLDWVKQAEEQTNSNDSDKNKEIDWKKLHDDNMNALAKADVVIAEASSPSFSTGYLVAMALQQKKPVLVLKRKSAGGGEFYTGLSSDFLYSEKYTNDNLQEIIAKFLQDNTIETKDMRFNFFIDRAIYNYLRWASFKSGKTKAEVLRELVQREINKEDY